MIPTIKDVDVAHGIENLGGDAELYIEVLGAYIEDTEKWLSVLVGYPGTSDLKTLATSVHGFKSASRNIGALIAGEQAYKMELKAKEGDAEYIAANIEAMKETMTVMLSECKRAVG